MSRWHRYKGEMVVVEFNLGRCIHTGDCTTALPEVFDTKRTGRWVHPDAASPEDVARVCAECPTGALRCLDAASGKPMHTPPAENTIQPMPDGPLYVHAVMRINGEPEPGYRAALCRCGASRLMPYCDNAHRETGFTDSGRVAAPMPDQQAGAGRLDIRTTPDGPLVVEGPFTLLDASGDEAVRRAKKAALCRCGGSNMKPYCDGSHISKGFKAN